MDVTILIPTYNGGPTIRGLLTSIAEAGVPNGLKFEILVVDNNSTDDTKETVLSFRERLPTLAYKFEGTPGKCRALNTVLCLAQGRLVAFLDHDVVVHPDYLRGLKEALANPGYKVFGGRIVAQWDDTAPFWVNRGKPLLLSRGGIIAHDYGGRECEYTREMRLPVGCNFFFRRELFDRVGNFNVHLGPRPGAQIAGEESDILTRFQRIGEKILYFPAATVYHPVVSGRVTRRDFRYRLFCAGRTVCRMDVEKPPLPKVFGIPRFLFRQFVEETGRMAVCFLKGDWFERFNHELNLWYNAGYIYESRRIAMRGLTD